MLTLPEAQLALRALGALCAGDREAFGLLRRLVPRVSPALVQPDAPARGAADGGVLDVNSAATPA
jgi:hypothetical protein